MDKNWDVYEMELAKELLIASFPDSVMEVKDLVVECKNAAQEFVKQFKK